jgi:high-affinity iron transporter
LVAQLVAAAVVLGSYFVAQDVRVRRPRLRGEMPAQRPEQPPALPKMLDKAPLGS